MSPARRTSSTSGPDMPTGAGRRRGEVGHTAGVTRKEGRLLVDEIGHRLQRSVQLRTRDRTSEARFGRENRVPRRRPVQIGEQACSVGAEHVGDIRVELGAAVAGHHPRRGGDAVPARERLGGARDLRQPGGQTDLRAAQLIRLPRAVPTLVGLGDGRAHRVVESQPPRELGSQR